MPMIAEHPLQGAPQPVLQTVTNGSQFGFQAATALGSHAPVLSPTSVAHASLHPSGLNTANPSTSVATASLPSHSGLPHSATISNLIAPDLGGSVSPMVQPPTSYNVTHGHDHTANGKTSQI